MSPYVNPAVQAFVEHLVSRADAGLEYIEVRIVVHGDNRFELRHTHDSAAHSAALETQDLAGLRRLARTNAAGAFRPNKAAPGLRRGWIFTAYSGSELERALDHLYPGTLPDWFAGRSANPPVTPFKVFTARQTGLYRITQILPPALAARTATACCTERFCLRQRLWTTEGLAPDPVEGKSVVPCLEPCSLMLDLARRAMKLEQEEKVSLPLALGDLPVLAAALERALANPDAGVREGNTMDAGNPRRMQLLLEAIRPLLPSKEPAGAAE